MDKYLAKCKAKFSYQYPDMQELKKRAEEIMREEVIETTTKMSCSRCKSTNISITSAQTRGSDEATTTFARCLDCGFTKKTN